MVKDNKTGSICDLGLARAAKTDPEAAEQLLRRVCPKIFQVVRYAVRNHNQAEDISQTAALEVMRSLSGYDGTGSLEGWAAKIAYRVTMRTMKKEREMANLFSPLKEEEIRDTSNPEKSLSRIQLVDTLETKMKRIPAHRRIPLILHLFYDYTVNEVAELTDASPNTVKDRLRTAYRELREILSKHPNLRKAMLEDLS